MQSSTDQITTIDQFYAKAGAMRAPVLIHVDGQVEWSNRSFDERFGVQGEAVAQTGIRELLWCLGILEPVAGMISEGLLFQHCEVPSANRGDSMLILRQLCLTMQPDGRKHMMLVLRDEFDEMPDIVRIGDQ